MPDIRFSSELVDQLICPVCKSSLQFSGEELRCQNCDSRYPILDSMPVIINEGNSIFSISDYLDRNETTYKDSSHLRELLLDREKLLAFRKSSLEKATDFDINRVVNEYENVFAEVAKTGD